MRRSLLGRCKSVVRSTRCLSAQAATAAEVPNDPDVLTTQPTELNQRTQSKDPSSSSSSGSQGSDVRSSSINSKAKYPRLQYKAPQLGVNPAYDLALEVIKQDRALTKRKISATRARIHYAKSKPDGPLKTLQLKDLHQHLRELETIVDINDPEIRWRHAHGDTDLSMPIYRHLDQRAWSEKPLLLLNQRVNQMNVTPDIIPFITPTVDLRLSFPGRTKGHRAGMFEVGELLSSHDSEYLPTIEIQSFSSGDEQQQRYTIAIVDPDVPDVATDGFTSYLHYLQKDVILGATTIHVAADNGAVTHTYIPPHPNRGTKYHRYTVLVWQQPAAQPQPNAPLSGDHMFSRTKFNAQHYAQQNGLHAVGINFWRQVWDSNVKTVMRGYPDAGYDDAINYRKIKA